MQTCLKSNEPAIRYGQVRDSLGAGSKVIEEYNPKYFSRRSKSAKSMYFRKILSIDISFINICTLSME